MRSRLIQINHTTINTGAQRQTAIDNIEAQAIAVMREAIKRGLMDGSKMAMNAMSMNDGVQRDQGLYTFEIERLDDLIVCFIMEKGRREKGEKPVIIQIAMAPFNDKMGGALWDNLLKSDQDSIKAKVPSAPWSALSLISIGENESSRDLSWVKKFEETLSWAWLSIIAEEAHEKRKLH